MKTKKILSTCAGLITIWGASAGGYYALNPAKDTEINPPKQNNIETNKGVSSGRNPTKNIRKALIDGNLSPLNTKTKEDDRIWQSLIEKFISGNLDKSKKISAVIVMSSNPQQDGPANMKNLKEACDALFEKTEDVDFEKNKELAENWCTKESSLLKVTSAIQRPS